MFPCASRIDAGRLLPQSKARSQSGIPSSGYRALPRRQWRLSGTVAPVSCPRPPPPERLLRLSNEHRVRAGFRRVPAWRHGRSGGIHAGPPSRCPQCKGEEEGKMAGVAAASMGVVWEVLGSVVIEEVDEPMIHYITNILAYKDFDFRALEGHIIFNTSSTLDASQTRNAASRLNKAKKAAGIRCATTVEDFRQCFTVQLNR